jgi:hypothetical protein
MDSGESPDEDDPEGRRDSSPLLYEFFRSIREWDPVFNIFSIRISVSLITSGVLAEVIWPLLDVVNPVSSKDPVVELVSELMMSVNFWTAAPAFILLGIIPVVLGISGAVRTKSTQSTFPLSHEDLLRWMRGHENIILTADEVSDAFDVDIETAEATLDELYERGAVQKEVGTQAVVWWPEDSEF